MNSDNEWNEILKDHPIFSLPKSLKSPINEAEVSLELSANTLSRFVSADALDDGPTPSGRRQMMLLKDADLIVAAGKEIRMTSLGDTKLGRSARKTYKTLHTPNVQFEIHQIALNPNGKLLAVAGTFQVAVIVLPRPGFARLLPETVDCKSVQVGQFYHATENSAPIAKIDWHPWGDAASTLLVMTVDGKLREYDISMDTEEPQQQLSFVPERKSKSYHAEDASEREVASFALGKGRADWGPLTIYALMRSGDIYAVCPYLPQRASVPSSYIHSLECFISAKQEFLAHGTSTATKNLSTLYDYQHKYVSALIKQLPPGTTFPATSRAVPIRPPTTIKSPLARQGPFLLQPAPRTLEGSEGGDATDIAYLSFGTDDDEDGDREGNPTEHLGIVTVAYQDGKVDLFLDVEKVEARWDVKGSPGHDLPMLAVYETIDLGLTATINSISNVPGDLPLMGLLQANHPVFLLDPIHDDTLYVYHAFGAHALYIGPVLQNLAVALRGDENEAALATALESATETLVQPLLTTFSIERRCSNPVIGVTLPNDVYLSYSILILTSAMRISVFPLTLRSDSPHERTSKALPAPSTEETPIERDDWLTAPDGPPAYVSLLSSDPYRPPPALSRPSGLPNNPRLALPPTPVSRELLLTPDTLRYLGKAAAQVSSQINDIQVAYHAAEVRADLQQQELARLVNAARDMNARVDSLRGQKQEALQGRFKQVQDMQTELLVRLDRLLSAMMKKASPELSEHETKWFGELNRMKDEVVGVGKYDDGSLAAKTKQLEREYARIMPTFKALLEKEKQRRCQFAEPNRNLGLSQAFEFGQRSNNERNKISGLEKEITKLADQLDMTLGKPPQSE